MWSSEHLITHALALDHGRDRGDRRLKIRKYSAAWMPEKSEVHCADSDESERRPFFVIRVA
jgi:hypothetical protein